MNQYSALLIRETENFFIQRVERTQFVFPVHGRRFVRATHGKLRRLARMPWSTREGVIPDIHNKIYVRLYIEFTEDYFFANLHVRYAMNAIVGSYRQPVVCDLMEINHVLGSTCVFKEERE